MNLGQVYTKDIVADCMVNLIDLPRNCNIVDPCCGKGVFVKSLLKAGFKHITGIEIDPISFSTISFDDYPGCNFLNEDFFSYTPSSEIDCFIMNPPYVRQEEIDDMEEYGVTKASISTKCGSFGIYSKANLYLYFVARCIALLKDNGQMIAIFPNAWLKTPEGNSFYAQIIEHGSIDNLINVIGVPFVSSPLVDVMIMKFTKGNSAKETIKQTMIINEDGIVINEDSSSLMFDTIDCLPLSSVAEVRRGITTGYNKAFINPPIETNQFLVDILSTPKDVIGYSTSKAKLDKLLLITNAEQNLPDNLLVYLNEIEKEIIDHGEPKSLANCIKSKKPWYLLSRPKESNIIFPYIIRSSVRFIINETKVLARDNFYTITSSEQPLLLLALLNNLYVYSQLELKGKSYGKGLLKIQKYDVDNLIIPNPKKIDAKTIEKLVKCSQELIKDGQYEHILEATSLLHDFYKIDNIENLYKSQINNRLNNGL